MVSENMSNTGGEPFHQLLTGAQSSLYAFICSLLGRTANASDILQETNFVLWEKADQFDPSLEFLPWAFKFAHLQVLAFRKRQQRDRLMFDNELVGTLATEFARNVRDVDTRLAALGECVEKLPESHRDLLRQYYECESTLDVIGKAIGRQTSAVAASLYRIRKVLSDCVERMLRLEGSS